MELAHRRSGHRGSGATLARFCSSYWVPHGIKLATKVINDCQLCKLCRTIFLEQKMGELPIERLKPAPAFTYVMLDLFGHYQVRGEVQKLISLKACGILFADLASRATHIEPAFGYDTSSFMLAFARFTSVRGWPAVMYSDPGSQLIGADNELQHAWVRIDKSILVRTGAENGTWKIGPADSPWNQGAVEALVKSAKLASHFAIQNQRLSPVEFMTVCYDVANLLNERPIGIRPTTDSEIRILTPNCLLLLGRATSTNRGGWQQGVCLNTRYQLVKTISQKFWNKWTELYTPRRLFPCPNGKLNNAICKLETS